MSSSLRPEDRISALSLRWAGIVVATSQLCYVIVSIFGVPGVGLGDNFVILNEVIVVVMLLLSIYDIYSVVRASKKLSVMACVLATYYISAILMTLAFSAWYAVASLLMIWFVLLAATGANFGTKPYFAGLATMIVTEVVSAVFIHHVSGHAASLTLALMCLLYISIPFLFYHNASVEQRHSYEYLKYRERLQTRRLKAVVNNLQVSILSLSPTRKIQLYNAAALSLVDTNDDIMGWDAGKVLNLVDENGDKVLLKDIISTVTRATTRRDLLLQYSDGQKINLELEIIPIKDPYDPNNTAGKYSGFILMMSDITKEKSLEDEKDEFISVVSHELRTPVAIAEGALSNLQFLMDHGKDPKMFRSTLDAAHNQILYLGQMVNDLSTLSRAQRGIYMDNEDINLTQFFSSMVTKYKGDAEKRGLKLIVKIDKPCTVRVPSMVIEEVMQNLITNAIKYTEKGSVTIGVKKGSEPDKVCLYVKDTGIGISKADKKHIFQRFWRSEDYRTRQTSGTGLGLHVVDQLMAKTGTKMKVDSEINKGSTFSFELPIVK